MNTELIQEALEIGLNYVLASGWTRHKEEEVEIIENALREVYKPKYFPLGQEPVNQQCLSCRLNCPNECPLDKQKDL